MSAPLAPRAHAGLLGPPEQCARIAVLQLPSELGVGRQAAREAEREAVE